MNTSSQYKISLFVLFFSYNFSIIASQSNECCSPDALNINIMELIIEIKNDFVPENTPTVIKHKNYLLSHNNQTGPNTYSSQYLRNPQDKPITLQTYRDSLRRKNRNLKNKHLTIYTNAIQEYKDKLIRENEFLTELKDTNKSNLTKAKIQKLEASIQHYNHQKQTIESTSTPYALHISEYLVKQ